MIDWAKMIQYPGERIANVEVFRGVEVGQVCVQHYGTSVKVAAFLPGAEIFLPGDTPKVEPERYEFFEIEDRAGAEQMLSAFLRDAQDEGWVIPLSTGANRETNVS